MFDTEIILWARSDTVDYAAQTSINVQLRKIFDEKSESQSASFDFKGAATWVGFILIIAGGIFITIRILKNIEKEDDDYGGWGEAGYQDSITPDYQSVISAPSITSNNLNSPEISSAPDLTQLSAVQTTPVVQQPIIEEHHNNTPPLPASGLPQGWSIEQWNAYGHEWLKHQQ